MDPQSRHTTPDSGLPISSQPQSELTSQPVSHETYYQQNPMDMQPMEPMQPMQPIQPMQSSVAGDQTAGTLPSNLPPPLPAQQPPSNQATGWPSPPTGQPMYTGTSTADPMMTQVPPPPGTVGPEVHPEGHPMHHTVPEEQPPQGKMGRLKEGIKQGWTDITTTTRKSAADVVVATETAVERANASVRESLSHVSKGVYQQLDKKFPGKDYDLKANRAAEKEQKAAEEARSAKERMKRQ